MKKDQPKRRPLVWWLLHGLPFIVMILAVLYAIYGVHRMVREWSAAFPEAAHEKMDETAPEPATDRSGWFFAGADWKCLPRTMNESEMQQHWQTPRRPTRNAVAKSDLEESVLELLSVLPFAVRESDDAGCRWFELENPGFRLRFAVREQRLLYAALAIRSNPSHWSVVEFTPADGIDADEQTPISAKPPLPMPENCVSLCVRCDSSGVPVFALVDGGDAADGSVWTDHWKSQGWSVAPNVTGTAAMFPFVCRKDGREIGVRVIDTAGRSPKIVLFDLGIPTHPF